LRLLIDHLVAQIILQRWQPLPKVGLVDDIA